MRATKGVSWYWCETATAWAEAARAQEAILLQQRGNGRGRVHRQDLLRSQSDTDAVEGLGLHPCVIRDRAPNCALRIGEGLLGDGAQSGPGGQGVVQGG